MATETYKVLAQDDPSASTLTDLYTVPAATEAVVSSIVVCNTAQQGSPSDAFIRISIAIAGAADADKQYIVRDIKLLKNETLPLTIGVTLAATDVIRIFSDQTKVSFQVFGTEIT